MNVYYDISVLGATIGNNRARTGIFRVVENVAQQLSTHTDISLQFTAVNRIKECLEYIDGHSTFSTVPLSYSLLPMYVENAKHQLSHHIKRSDYPTKHALKLARELLNGTQKLLTKIYGEGNVTRIDGDIFHSPFLPLPKNIHAKLRFITVYDLIPILQPQFFKFQEDHVLHRIVKSIDFETWVFCISEATKNDLLNFSPTVDPKKVAVIPLGASDLFFQCRDETILQTTKIKYGIPDQPYFLSLSTLEPRKNIDATIRAFVKMVRQERLNDVNLVLVGTKGWDFGKVFDEISASDDLRARIIVTGYVDDDDLASIYSAALAFVYPSFYEGFGLPPLEAMQCGIPVITSNTSSLPEVVGDAGIQVDPNDDDALCQAMLEMYQNAPHRQQLSERSLKRARLYSWNACADVTINHYREAMNNL